MKKKLYKMCSLHLIILSVSLAVFTITSVKAFDIEVKNLLAIHNNDKKSESYMEFYNAKTNEWKALATTNINITEYGVAMYRDRLFLIGGRRFSDDRLSDEVNEVDLLSGRINIVNYLKQPRKNPSVAVVGEGKSSVLYIMGGRFPSGAVTANVERWDESAQEWMYVKSMVAACEGAAVVVHKSGIYVFGGFNGDQFTDTVQVYDLAYDWWTIKRPMSTTKGYFYGASDGRYIFVVGGFFDYSDPNSVLNTVERYDPENDIWVSLADLNDCYGSVGVNFLNDQLYAIGGTYCATTQIYHQNINTWQRLSPLTYKRSSNAVVKVPFTLKDYEFNWIPGKRSTKDILVLGLTFFHSEYKMELYNTENDYWRVMKHEENDIFEYKAAFVNDRLIIAGGYDDSDDSASDKVFEIALETGKLLPLSSMNLGRLYAQLVVVGEGKSARLYVLGGRNHRDIYKSCERWDPFTDTWEFVSPMIHDRSSFAAVLHKGNIYTFGGQSKSAEDRLVDVDYNEVYLIDKNKWESRAPMIHKTSFCSAVSDGKYIYVVGGNFNESISNQAYRYDASSDTWKTVASTTSKGTMGISLLDNAPIVFGGDEYGSYTDIVEIYDVDKDEWRKLAPMKNEREISNALQVPWKWKYFNTI